MEILLDSKTKEKGLIVGHMIITDLINKKNRNGKMERIIKDLETDVKQNPDKYLKKMEIDAYEKLSEQKSAIKSSHTAARILLNIIINQGKLPTISRIVDCMNIVSVKTGLTISIWNMDKLEGKITYKMSEGNEKYWPFMGDEVELEKDELATFNEEKVLGLVRYRDSKYAPVTLETKNILIHIQGVNGITKESVQNAMDELQTLIIENIGGNLQEKTVHH